MCPPTFPIIPIPQASKSSYPASSCSARSALTCSSNLPPPPADLLSFTKVCCNLPLAPDLQQDPKASHSFDIYSCRLSFPPIFFKRAGFPEILEHISSSSSDSEYLMLYVQRRADFAAPQWHWCSSLFGSKFTGGIMGFRLILTLQWSNGAAVVPSHCLLIAEGFPSAVQMLVEMVRGNCSGPQIYIYFLMRLK